MAEVFGKRHDNVLRDIADILRKSEETPSDWFRLSPTVNPQNGQQYPAYDMTRDGFTLPVMGYSGAKAMRFKVA